MKRLFNHRKRPYEEEMEYDEWDEADYEAEDDNMLHQTVNSRNFMLMMKLKDIIWKTAARRRMNTTR